MDRFLISKTGLISSCLFLLGALLFRSLLPFGDEPDFTVKAYHIKHESHLVSSGYYLLSPLTQKLNIESRCVISASPTSLVAHIDNSSCTETLQQIFLRTAITGLTTAPLLVLIIFRRQFKLLFFARTESFDWSDRQRRLDSVSIALLTPGIFYHLGLLSNEQLTLTLSVLIFIFLDRKFILILLLTLVAAIDFGNAVVVTLFLTTRFTIEALEDRVGRRVVIGMLASILAVLWIMGFSILSYIPGGLGPLAIKASAMLEAFTEGSQADRLNKYPTLLRPVITFMSLIFFTPNYVKVVLLYPIVAAGLIYAYYKLDKANRIAKNAAGHQKHLTFSLLWASAFTILSFTLLFPTYANAKYYAFVIPIIIYAVLPYFSRKGLMLFCGMLSITSLVHLTLFRL